MIIILKIRNEFNEERLKEELKRTISNFLAAQQMDTLFYFEEDRYFTFTNGNEITAIRYADILFFEKLDKQIHIHTEEERYCYYGSMISLENDLNPEQFVRVHQGYIVNRSKILAYLHGHLILERSHQKIPVSRRHQKCIKAIMR